MSFGQLIGCPFLYFSLIRENFFQMGMEIARIK